MSENTYIVLNHLADSTKGIASSPIFVRNILTNPDEGFIKEAKKLNGVIEDNIYTQEELNDLDLVDTGYTIAGCRVYKKSKERYLLKEKSNGMFVVRLKYPADEK